MTKKLPGEISDLVQYKPGTEKNQEKEVSPLVQYVKIGFGTVTVIAGAKEYLRELLSKANMEEALYRGLEKVNMDTIMEAKQSLNSAWDKMDKTYVIPVMIAVGAGFIASGIYNLAKKHRSETVE